MPKNTQLQRIRHISAGALAAAAVLAGGISVQLHAAATSSTEATSGSPSGAVRTTTTMPPLREGAGTPDTSTAGS